MKTSVPFPQADNVYKLLIFFFRIAEAPVPFELLNMSVDEMVPRQESYYKAALEYLGLLHNGAVTKEGLYLLNSDMQVMLRLLVLRMLVKEPFANYYHYRNEQVIESYLSEQEALSESTVYRRKQTVISWISWIDQIVNKGDKDD
jgi:hypothetical protein